MISVLTWARALIFLPLVVMGTLTTALFVIFISMVSVDLAMSFIRFFWAKPLLWSAGISLEVRGLERFKKEKGSLIVFNHTSHLDIPIIFSAIPKSVFFGSKIELFKIPFFGQAMKAVGALPIDRRQRSRVMKVYAAAVPRLKKGETFALAPEGTRQVEPRIGTFKRGPFEFAAQAETLIQPLVISGALRVLPNHTVLPNLRAWRSQVIIEFLNPIFTHKEDDPTHLMEVARSHMTEKLAELNEDLGIEA